MKLNCYLIFFAFFFVPNLYSQTNNTGKKPNLSSSLISFEILTNALVDSDTLKLKFVVTEKAFKSFNLKNLSALQELGLDWKNKKVAIIKANKTEETLKIEGYYVPLKFVRDSNGDWKFSMFSID